MRRESLPTQGEFDLDGTKANHDSHPDASTINRTGATDIVDESDQGDRYSLASFEKLTGYSERIDHSNPDAMMRMWCAITEKAGSFDGVADRIHFMVDAAGPVIDSLFKMHLKEYTKEDGSLDPHTIRLDVMGRLSIIFGASETAAALGQWFEDHSEHFERSSANKASQGISRAAVGAVVSS